MANEVLILFLTSLFLDLTIGELPSSIHPVVWMGKLITIMKTNLFNNSNHMTKIYGVIMTVFLIFMFVSLFTIILVVFSFNKLIFLFVAALLFSTTFSIKMLLESARMIVSDLDEDIEKGRKSLSFLVSRPTSNLSLKEVISATIETLTENIVDSSVSPFFYAILFPLIVIFSWPMISSCLEIGFTLQYQLLVISSVAAGVSYRVVNTLDAMVGYKDPINIDIGWFPAKLDDFLNFIPARITGLLIVIAALIISADFKEAWKIMLKDSRKTHSPNSGYTMAAAAGALNVQLSKPGIYRLGTPKEGLTIRKIKQAIKLSKVTIILFAGIISIILLLINL